MHIPFFGNFINTFWWCCVFVQSRKNFPKIMTEDIWTGCVDGYCKILKISNGFFYQRQTLLKHQPARAGEPRVRSKSSVFSLQDYVFDFVQNYLLKRADQIPNTDHSVLRLQLPVSVTLTSLWHDYKTYHLADADNSTGKVASWVRFVCVCIHPFPYQSSCLISYDLHC
jgi:hypothetical protein